MQLAVRVEHSTPWFVLVFRDGVDGPVGAADVGVSLVDRVDLLHIHGLNSICLPFRSGFTTSSSSGELRNGFLRFR